MYGLPVINYLIFALLVHFPIAGSRPDEVNDFLSLYLILPAALGPGVY
jgi:hypothetical protein